MRSAATFERIGIVVLADGNDFRRVERVLVEVMVIWLLEVSGNRLHNLNLLLAVFWRREDYIRYQDGNYYAEKYDDTD
jgi:hypothetical protein